METLHTDCLVIGAGLAGSAYALHAARAGLKVELLSLGGPLEANSDWAQGGIIYDTTSRPEDLARDILIASDHTANPAAVEQLVREGPAAIEELLLDTLHVGFDRRPSGQLDFTREAGHSTARIIHSKDTTGHAILSKVATEVDTTPAITRRSGWVAVDLLTLSHNSTEPLDRYQPLTCLGCYALRTQADDVVAIVARKTILATGGLGGIFLHSTNHPGSVGQGIAMAWRVGARLMDLEYVQFHPTVFFKKNSPRFLLTEALRGEGGVLVDEHGDRFMDKVDPRGSLAPRDVVSRAIQQHLARTGETCVYLDLSALKPETIRERFPAVYERCRSEGVDITKERIPVVPAAHYTCGGIYTDLAGRTTVTNLNAIGETACTGLHGANRLASTSLLEGLVGARSAARADIADLHAETPSASLPRPWESPTKSADPLLIRQDLQLVQQTMWNYAGILRSPRRLARARRILLELREGIQNFYRDCRPTRELIELRSAVQCGLLVVHAASLNPSSRGSHFIQPDDET